MTTTQTTPPTSLASAPDSAPDAWPQIQHPIIFFDGVCQMCNRFVDRILQADSKEIFHFAPLQGTTAQRLLPPLSDDPSEWAMLYLDEQGVHDQSDATLAVYRRLGGRWSVLSLARFIPRGIRNPIYRLIARNRYRLFGRRDTCRLPTEQEKARFLA